VHLLVNDCVPTPMLIWENLGPHLSLDYTLRHHNMTNLGFEYAMQDLAKALRGHGKSLAAYNLPEPTTHGREVEHELGRWNTDPESLATSADTARALFNAEQCSIYDDVLKAVIEERGLHIFVDGKAGTGKTYLVNMICNKIRSLGRIVLPTAIAAFAAQHYAGGRTTHSAFKVSPFVHIPVTPP
jgi:Cdc6-like AAA superfamily ATPase